MDDVKDDGSDLPDTVDSRSAWRRAAEDIDFNGRLGAKLRALREARGLSLRKTAELTGVAGPTLSRIETNKMVPTFALVSRIVTGLGFELSQLMTIDEWLDDDRISISRSRTELRIPGIVYHSLHAQAALSRFLMPVVMEITATQSKQMGGLAAHDALEFCYVLEGCLELQFEGRPSEVLNPGESAMFDARVPHAYVVKKGERVCLLNVQRHLGPAELQEQIALIRGARNG